MRLIQLARELTRLRDQAGITREQVCDALGISSPTLSRIENAGTAISPDTVAALVELYGRPDRKAALVELARDTQKRGWWQAFRDVFPTAYVGLENDASAIWTFEPLVVPGLLQTPGYARAIIESSPSPIPEETEERRVQARIARQALLTRGNPPELHAILGEAVLHQVVGGSGIMRLQVLHLWEMAQRKQVTVQIVPFAAGAHRGLDGSFSILAFAEIGMEIGFTEGPGGSIYLESQASLAEINLRRESIQQVALSPKESEEMLRTFADRI